MPPKESNPKTPSASPGEASATQCAIPMDVSSELLTALQVRFKLTEPQSRVYTVLLVMGQLTTDEISNYSGIPMLKISNIIEVLVNKQLIKSLPGVVPRYRAFAPYKELAEEVKAFTTATQKSWKELQKIQTKTLSEIHDELQLMTRQTQNALENLNERQGIALNEAAMATNIVLSNVAESLQKSLENLSTSSVDEISKQTTTIQEELNSLIDEGITQLDDAQKLRIEDMGKVIDVQQEEAEHWLSSTVDQLLAQTIALTQHVETQLNDAEALLQRNIDSGIKSAKSEITSQNEGISEITEETTSNLTNDIEAYNQETQQVLDTLQKEIKQTLTKHTQDLSTQVGDTWTKRTQALDKILSQLDKAFQKEHRQLVEHTETAATSMESTIKSNHDSSLQIIKTLFQDLKKVHNQSSVVLGRLHKEAETTVKQWPPSSLDFSQFSKIKTSLPDLTNQVKREHEQLLENASQDLVTEMRDAYSTQLLEVQTLLQTLIEETKTQQTNLADNFKSIAKQVGRRLKRRSKTIQKTSDSFISDFQTKMDLQEEQIRALGKQMQKLLSTESTTAIKAFEVTENQLMDFAGSRLDQAQSEIKQSATENLVQATKGQKAVEKQVQSFNAAMKKIIRTTTSELEQELSKLEKIVSQYSDETESTADKLREEKILKVETVIGNYQPTITELQNTRDKAIAKSIRLFKKQLKKREQTVLSDLNTNLSEDIPLYALAALNEYQTALEKNKASLDREAETATEAVISKQLTASKLKGLTAVITKTLNEQIDEFSDSIQEVLVTNQNLQSTQVETAFNLARDEFVEVYGQQISRYNDRIARAFVSQIKPIIRDCKTKVSRQTKREKQIGKLIQTAHDKILALLEAVLPKNKKTVHDKSIKELESIFQTFKTKLKRQTNREKKIKAIFQSSMDSLEAFPETLLSEISKQHLNDQVMDLLAIFVDYRLALERQHMINQKNIGTEFQSLLEQFSQLNYTKTLKPKFKDMLKKSANNILDTYREKIEKNQEPLKSQAEETFQTALEKQLQSQLQPKLEDYPATRLPPISEPVNELETELNDTVTEFDTNARTQVEKYWLPLKKIVDEYSSAVVANLTALNTATVTAVDQATVNVNTSLTSFADDAGNLLTATVQVFDREKSGMTDQITHAFNKIQEDCTAKLQDTQALLKTLGSDISTQKIATKEKIETLATEIDSTTKSNLAAIHEVANSFVENVQTELQTQQERVDNLRSNVQDLIHKQGEALTEGVNRIQTQLVEFSQTQIPKGQSVIEEIGETCSTRLDEQRTAIGELFETFSVSLAEEVDDYTSTLQQELVQLQTVISKLIEKLGETTETIDTELIEQIETSKVNLVNAINAQETALNKETSVAFQSLAKESRELQTQIHDNLQRVTEEGKTVLEQNQTDIATTFEETLKSTLMKSEKSYQTQLGALTTQTKNVNTKIEEKLSTIANKISTSSNQLSEALTATLTDTQTEITKLVSNTNALIEEDRQNIQTEIGQEVEKALQNQSKSLNLTKSRLNRVAQDSTRRTTESLQSFKGTASTDLQQKSKTIVASINQVLDNAKEGLVTQTQQTGRRISRTLSKERQTFKSEYQTLSKEITARAKTAETTTANSLQLFSDQTEPTLKRLRSQAAQTEQILIGLWETLTKLEPSEAERTWRIVTCEGIQNHLLDMFRRVNETITLVYPSFDEVPVTELSKVTPQNRVHIITTLEGDKQRASAQKLLQQGNVRIWNNPKMEFYGGSRDGQEVLIAPTYGNKGEIVAIVSDQASYIALFNQTLGPRWISASKEVRL